MAVIPPRNRPALNSFWRLVRQSLNDQDDEIDRLRALLGPATSATRPDTSDSVVAVRDSVQAALHDQGLLVLETEVSDTLNAIWNMDPIQANQILGQRNSSSNSSGCWLSSNAAAHENGYQKVNLRNTWRMDGSSKFGCSPFLHQVAAVAAGYGGQLLSTAADHSAYQVSHLCHHPGCFNPAHIVVESCELNKARNECAGSYIVHCQCGAVYHPCTHGQEELHLVCILPRSNGQGARYHHCDPQGYYV